MKASVKSKSQHKNRGDRPNLKVGIQKAHAKFLKSYYGNPTKDLKLITITGSTGKAVVAHYIYEILLAAGESSAVLFDDPPFGARTLHKFLREAINAKAKYAVITVPVEGLRNHIFYDLPITIAAMTNFVTAGLSDMTPEAYIENEQTLFRMKPEITILNSDDAHYQEFRDFRGTKETLIYGSTGDDVKVLNSKLYPKGTEATLSIRGDIVTVASFLTGETTVSYMAAAAAMAYGLGLSTTAIIEGIASYDAD